MSTFDFSTKKFVKEVLAFMTKNNISHRAFAELAGTSPMTLYRAMNGQYEMRLSTIRKIEKAMAKYVEDLE